MSLATALAVAALAVGLVSAIVGITGDVDVGLVADDPGGVVIVVARPGPAWDAGIRPGQRVLAVAAADSPGGWSIQTSDGLHEYRLTAEDANAPLRAAAALAVAGVLLGLLGLRDRRLRRRRAELASSLALLLAAAPALVVARDAPGLAVVALGGAAPAVWIARWGLPPRIGAPAVPVLLVSAAIGAAAWSARMGGVSLVGEAWAAAAGVAGGTALAMGAGVTRSRISAAVRGLTMMDGAVAATLVLAAAAVILAGLPGPWAFAAVVVALLLYARARATVRRALDNVLLADLRERAAIRATEEERARMAREIHDDPLQAIAGVIQRLEGASPDTESARSSLREVAARLRGVATELHPPILDDLGLVPAVEAAARTSDGGTRIVLDIRDLTGYGAGGRPAPEVELAAYRVVQEAMANAVRHSGGSTVTVSGSVSADVVHLDVVDDGRGFSQAEADLALRQGHLGLASMRQRSAAVGASLEAGRAPGGGARVSFRWPA